MAIYIVKEGDSLDGIAAAYGADPLAVSYDNQIPYPYNLTVGEALWIEADRSSANSDSNNLSIENNLSTAINLSIKVGGYAYPFISRYVLEQTLPYLTDLMIFSYGFTSEGDLIPPRLPDDWMISLALQYNTAPILTLTPFGPDGRFNNYLISQIVRSSENRNNLINQIVETIGEKGYQGVDIDFEYILAEDRDGFTNLVREITEAVNVLGYPVSVALAPKTSAGQQGLLYEGKDYPALGQAADYVLLMTYEWGYTYGPPMAVAPINNVRQVLDYAVTEIDPAKIHLGIPNYGYDWPLPFLQGQTRATTLGTIEARQRAVQYGAPIFFDETAQSPYYQYQGPAASSSLEGQESLPVYMNESYAAYSEGIVTHEVWFEDVRSMQAKLALISEYGLRGAGYWNIMNLFRANWLVLRAQYGT
ncbi:MAG: glycoside hydrolase [Eubacterium sp.]|nr:glycoside hydrolase [Eubacterium sp.]